MDRNDEARDRRTDDAEAEDTARSGDVLGLGGAAVPKTPGDPSASDDPDSAARRRERLREEEEAARTENRGGQRSGATGIDMGAGGQGTDISGK